MEESSGIRAPRRLPLLVFAVVGAGLVLAAVLLDRSMREGARTRASAELAAVAALQADAVTRFRGEHLGNVAYAASYPSVIRAAGLAHGGHLDAELAAHLVEILGHLGERHGYLRIDLLDAEARSLAAWRGPSEAVHGFDRALVDLALASGDAPVYRHHEHAEGEWSDLDAAVAVRPRGAPACVLALRVSMGPFLEGLLEGWPSAGATASTALIRPSADGASALVFGEQILRESGQRSVKVPLALRERLAAQALTEPPGQLLSRDFRGNPVLAASRAVPGTDWRLVAKMDLAEIEAPLVRPAGAIFLLVGALLAAGAILLLVWWRQEARRGRVESALRESQERLKLALSGSIWVWEWDLAGGRYLAERPPNITAERLVRLDGAVEEILARLVLRDDLPVVRARLEAHLRGEVPEFTSEHRANFPETSERWVLIRGKVVARGPDGRPARLLGVATDVTERRTMQAQLEQTERMASLGTLAAGVAHEINNPLAALMADLDTVARAGDAIGAEAGAALADARDAAERVLDVARSLRVFARSGSTERRAADVRAELDAAIRLARNLLRHRARLALELGPMPLVVASHHELGQVFLNLLVNAAQAIPDGREGLVTVVARTGGDGWAVVEVRDDGTGIPPEVMRRLFQPFHTTKPQGVGTGLGLAIAQSIVTASGGRIEVESEVGKGTVFRVLLPPAPEVAKSPTSTPTPTSALTPPPESPRRVLVIDDDPLVARAVVRSLGRGHQVTTINTAQEALVRLTGGEAWDAILCDLMMPEMTGMELHDRLACACPEAVRRMAFITGGAFTERANAFLRRPDVTFLEKPFAPEALRATVARLAAAVAAR